MLLDQEIKIKKLKNQGDQRISKMLGLKKLVWNIRTIKTLLKHSFLAAPVKESIPGIKNRIIVLGKL